MMNRYKFSILLFSMLCVQGAKSAIRVVAVNSSNCPISVTFVGENIKPNIKPADWKCDAVVVGIIAIGYIGYIVNHIRQGKKQPEKKPFG